MYSFITLLHLMSSFLLIRSLLVWYAYISIESIDCILSSSFELKAILLISTVKKLWLLLLLLIFVVFLILIQLFLRILYDLLYLWSSTSIVFFSRWNILFSNLGFLLKAQFFSFMIFSPNSSFIIQIAFLLFLFCIGLFYSKF